MIISLLIYIGLMINIFYLQIIEGNKIASKAAAMRDNEIEVKEYTRGEILDRNLMPLTDTISSNAVYCLPGVISKQYNKKISGSQKSNRAGNREVYREAAEFLSSVIKDKPAEEIINSLENVDQKKTPIVRIASSLNAEQVAKINSSNISGLVVAPVIKRYRTDGFFAHMLGYVNGGYNDGKAGIENAYNDILKDNPPTDELISVLDARGMVIQGLMFKIRNEQDKNRSTVVLTIDKSIQQIVENAMNKGVKRGAVVVMDVKTKEVLAMASRPTFNPDNVEDIIQNDNQSTLMNRALTCYYPGSLFKILLSSAALEEKAVKTTDKFNCNGKYIFNDEVSISCWKEEGHGEIDFSQAFALSCNPSFIQAGLRLGRTRLLHYVDAFHLTDNALAGYPTGTNKSYVKIDGGEPALGNASLGQRGVMVSPLQITTLLATIADDGSWDQPSIVRYSINSQGQKNVPFRKKQEQVISIKTAREVRGLLEKVVNEGTGKTAALAEVKVAGKTATSQTGQVKDDQTGKSEEILNTWFGGYFPADNPQWVIVVMVEEGTSGAESAAPVFKEIAQGILKCYSVR
jgi:peptidoglycan glycosyltransferase/penicillin-binding protein 2